MNFLYEDHDGRWSWDSRSQGTEALEGGGWRRWPWVWNWQSSRKKPWVGLEFIGNKVVQKVVFSEAGSLWDQLENSQGCPEVGQDDLFGHDGEIWLWLETWNYSGIEYSSVFILLRLNFSHAWSLFCPSGSFQCPGLPWIRGQGLGGAVLGVWPEKREMFFSRSLVDINLQKQPELGETQAILVWKQCFLPELPPSCQTSGPILGRIFFSLLYIFWQWYVIFPGPLFLFA